MLVFRWQFHTFIPRVSLGLIKPSISLLNSTLPWSQVSQVDELSALLSKKAAPSGSEPAAAASEAAAYVAYLETGA